MTNPTFLNLNLSLNLSLSLNLNLNLNLPIKLHKSISLRIFPKTETMPISVLDRFLRYVQIDTTSDPDSKTVPSTERQKDLSRILVQELKEIGVVDAELDDKGYVYATIPANTDKEVSVLCFCSHVDTSPDAPGKGVKPIVHKNYQGEDLILPDDNAQVIRAEAYPELRNQIGNDIVTASGTTLLGADNKAGVAEIMTAAEILMNDSDIKHGKIRILFTPDEEIGRGVDHVDMEKLGADFGYTMDGANRGSLEDETFSADGATITIRGVGIHPGFAKDKLESALKIASDLVAALPKDRLSPETTSGREGFIHPVSMSGTVEEARITFILRSFTEDGLEEQAAFLRKLISQVLPNYPGSSAELEVKEQYRNMKEILDQHPQVVAFAEEAIRRAGMEPIKSSIRGGTDGSRLSFMGLPCPNIFAGEQAFHSRHEWVSVQDMEAAMRTIIELVQVWEREGAR
jgi:tripeptide aminopeptidase